jgi:hypothetical protein
VASLPRRQLLEEFQRNRATYQAFRPLGTREEVQALRKALQDHTLHGQLARYSGPSACAEVPVTPEEEAEESRMNLERLRRRMEDGTLDADDDTDDEGTTHFVINSAHQFSLISSVGMGGSVVVMMS